ncbi:hypothetical protein TNCV_72371 [Trichonephila clavipes]|uniref:Uncharacterized protein n=1 Tax=Trichonephila clavipes TaxID=2585209 RepID=A0A8X6RCC8_TRICX|nr:hypothetical protein TNCV_72371 [Trichonephila clavipes]
MAALMEAWSATEIRDVIRFLSLTKSFPAEIHRQLVEVYTVQVLYHEDRCALCAQNLTKADQMRERLEPIDENSACVEVGKPIDENSACVEVGKPIDENPACVQVGTNSV